MTELLDLVGPWLCLGVLFGVPVASAWWLSDGFQDLPRGSGYWPTWIAFDPYTEWHGFPLADPPPDQFWKYIE